MKTNVAAFCTATLLVGSVIAVCPGYNYAIGNQITTGNGVSHWNVYDDGCNIVQTLVSDQNPCTSGVFSCSAAPITFNGYTNTPSGLQYACRTDPNSGACTGDTISVCCRNDGG